MRLFAFDHNGVIEDTVVRKGISKEDLRATYGTEAERLRELNDSDIALTELGYTHQAVPQGKTVFAKLKRLTTTYPDLILAHHSGNTLRHQVRLVRQIETQAPGVMPHFKVMPVKDDMFAGVKWDNPAVKYLPRTVELSDTSIEKSQLLDAIPEGADIDDYTIVVGWQNNTEEPEGKMATKNALIVGASAYQEHKPSLGKLDTKQSVIFDDGPANIASCGDDWYGIQISGDTTLLKGIEAGESHLETTAKQKRKVEHDTHSSLEFTAPTPTIIGHINAWYQDLSPAAKGLVISLAATSIAAAIAFPILSVVAAAIVTTSVAILAFTIPSVAYYCSPSSQGFFNTPKLDASSTATHEPLAASSVPTK